VPRLALSVGEACEALGCGWDFFSEHIAPELRMVRRGRRKLIPVAEIERWLDAEAERTLPDTGMGSLAAREVPANRGVRASRAPVRRAA
jgi:excisionase family DNA binding protein